MACCNKNRKKSQLLNIPNDQQKIIDAVSNQAPTRSSKVTPGTPLKTCQNCFTKAASVLCPVCGSKLLK